MIKEVTTFSLICDNCNRLFMSSFEEFALWVTESDAVEASIDDDQTKYKGKHYCPNCYELDDNDNIVIIEKEEKND